MSLTEANEQSVIIPHKYRDDRRAVHHPEKRVIRMEMKRGDQWFIDYTTYENEAQSDHFREFYGNPAK